MAINQIKVENTTHDIYLNKTLTIQGNGTTLTNGSFDGSANKTVNITPKDIGAMTTSNPTGTGSLSINRKASTTVGTKSVALGSECTASGAYSYAEGISSEASGDYSHAEGFGTEATGDYSHAEGSATVASGEYSHSEGWESEARGKHSHAEGQYTIATSEGCHTQGRYNVIDSDGIYAHIVGNGTKTARSNAHTLDWNGNAWYKGNVYIGGTNQNEGQRLLKTSVCCARGNTASLSLSASAITTVTLNTWISRTDTAFTFSNGGIKCPVAGTVRVSGGVYIHGQASSGSAGVYIYKGSSEITSNYAYLNQTSHAETVVDVAAGDIIYLKARSATAATCVPNNVATQLNVQYI